MVQYNATNSISTYLARNASDGGNIDDLVSAWGKNIPTPSTTPASASSSTPATTLRSKDDITTVEAKYAKAEQILASILSNANKLPVMTWQLTLTTAKAATFEDIAYMLKVDPDFFTGTFKECLNGREQENVVNAWAKNSSISTMGKNTEQLINEIKAKVATVQVTPRPTEREKSQRAALDHEAKVKSAMATDRINLLANFSAIILEPTSKKTLGNYSATYHFATTGQGVDIRYLKLCIASNVNVQDQLYDSDYTEQRRLLTVMIGEKDANDVPRDQLADKILEVSKKYEENNAKIIKDNNTRVTQAKNSLNPEAMDIITRLKNDPENAKIVTRNDGSYVMYNTQTNKVVRVSQVTVNG